MPASDRCRFFETIGLQAILDHIPATWVRAVERIVRPSDWKPSAEMPTACHDNDNLEIHARLKREPENCTDENRKRSMQPAAAELARH
jgi:hypothetical protein